MADLTHPNQRRYGSWIASSELQHRRMGRQSRRQLLQSRENAIVQLRRLPRRRTREAIQAQFMGGLERREPSASDLLAPSRVRFWTKDAVRHLNSPKVMAVSGHPACRVNHALEGQVLLAGRTHAQPFPGRDPVASDSPGRNGPFQNLKCLREVLIECVRSDRLETDLGVVQKIDVDVGNAQVIQALL